MKAPVRLADTAQLPRELSLALRSAPPAPTATELQALAGQLGQTLGVTLALPPALALRAVEGSGAPAATAAKAASAAAATKGSSAVTPLVLGAWVMGGLVLGAGASGLAAHYAGFSDHPGPAASSIQTSRQPPAQPLQSKVPNLQPKMQAETATRPKPRLEPPGSVTPPSAVPAPALQPSERPELSLLRQAQEAVATAPARALSLCATHAERFGGGVLGQEREVIAIDALLRLGRVTEARQRAERFRVTFPGSAHTRRIDAALER